MIEEEFYRWYRSYNPEMDPELDDMLDELRSCWYRAWFDGRSHLALDKLAQEGQEFDNEIR